MTSTLNVSALLLGRFFYLQKKLQLATFNLHFCKFKVACCNLKFAFCKFKFAFAKLCLHLATFFSEPTSRAEPRGVYSSPGLAPQQVSCEADQQAGSPC